MSNLPIEFNQPSPFNRLSFEAARTLTRETLYTILDDLTKPLVNEKAESSLISTLSPDRRWSVAALTDTVSGWTTFNLIHQSDNTTYNVSFPPARAPTVAWFRDSSGFVMTGFPDAIRDTSIPCGPERLMIFDIQDKRLLEVPLEYPEDARIGMMINDSAGEVLISLREGNHKFRALKSLSLASADALTFVPIECSPGYYPLQPWHSGYLGISDGAHGRGQLEVVARGSAPVIVYPESEYILRTAVASQEKFALACAQNGRYQLVEKRFEQSSVEQILECGNLVPERLRISADGDLSVTVSRLDIAPIDVPFRQEAHDLLQNAFPLMTDQYQYREFSARDGTLVPVEIFLPAVERTDRLLVCAYGAWGMPLDGRFNALRSAWLELGGTVALVGVRGGGEKGAQWHIAGQGSAKRQAVHDFSDVVDSIRRDTKLSRYDLVGYGYSAGATIISSALARCPNLLSRAVLEAGVYDMARFHEYGLGAGWKNEFGDPTREPHTFTQLSPLSLGSSPVEHASLLVVTGRDDGTVTVEHSLTYAHELAKKWGETAVRLEQIPGVGHILEAPLKGRSDSIERQIVLDILLKELAFLRSIDI